MNNRKTRTHLSEKKRSRRKATICRIEGCGQARDPRTSHALCWPHFLAYYRNRYNRDPKPSSRRMERIEEPVRKRGLTTSDLMHLPAGRAAEAIDRVLAGETILVGGGR